MSGPSRQIFQQHIEALMILAALVLMAYSNSFQSAFVVDARPLILESVRVHSVTLGHLKEILFQSYAWPIFDSGLYRPLTTLSYLANYALLDAGDQPAFYHWTNCLLHAANAFLVYLLVLKFVRQYWVSLFAASLWALHPICTEAVTNIAGRPEPLAAFGVLGALVLYSHDEQWAGWRKTVSRTAMIAAAGIAVFSKESGVMVLALVVLYDFTYRTRRGASARELATGFWRFFRQGYSYLAVPVLAMLCLRWLALRRDGAMEIQFVDNPMSGAGFLVGRATALSVLGRYFGLLAWPRLLSCDYSFNQIPLLHWYSMTWRDWCALAVVAGLLSIWVFCYRHSKTGFFLLGFSALTLLPTSNLLVTTGTNMAERLLYLPAVGFTCAVAIGIHRIAQRLGLRPLVAAIALGFVGVGYGARTYQRNFDWKDGETLYTSAAQVSPESVRPHLSLAVTRYALDPSFVEGDRAIAEAERAAEIVSGLPDREVPAIVYTTLGNIYCARGDLAAAKDADGNPHADAASAEWYRKALAADLRAVVVDQAYNDNHRRIELARGRPADEIAPAGLSAVDINLGSVYLRLGDTQRALQIFLRLRHLQPATPSTYALISSAYQAQNETAQAATAMLESYVVGGTATTLARVAQLYSTVDGGGCVTVAHAEGLALNHDCALVRRDLCTSYRELQQAARDAKQRGMAERFAEAGRALPGCQ
jgi:tetratricopeptide (TPR) repeat protein